MNRSKQPAPKISVQREALAEQVEALFEEIDFAIRWQRPSILLAVCESSFIRAEAELALEKRLAEIGQGIVPFTVDKKRFDIPQILARRADREQCVYSIRGLSNGGGVKGSNAYRALNIRREYFVDYAVRALFWLTKKEARGLPRLAPDFWVFRHHVVEFVSSLATKDKTGRRNRETGNTEAMILAQENALANLLDEENSSGAQFELLDSLVGLSIEKQDYTKAVEFSKRGLQLAQQLDSIRQLANFHGHLGSIHLAQKDYPSAIRVYRQATRLVPQNADCWNSLGNAYLVQGRADLARGVFRKAIRLNPWDAAPWAGLGQAYAALNRTQDAIRALQQAVQFAPQDADHWSDLGNLYLENGKIQEALEACNKSVKLDPKNPASWASLGHAYRLKANFSDAIIAYRQALVLDPHNPSIHSSLDRLLSSDKG